MKDMCILSQLQNVFYFQVFFLCSREIFISINPMNTVDDIISKVVRDRVYWFYYSTSLWELRNMSPQISIELRFEISLLSEIKNNV